MKPNLMKSPLMFMALGAVVLTSCSKNSDGPDNDPVAVHFTSAIAAPTPMTKASGATWTSGDNVGIFMVATETTTIAENAENRKYTTSEANTFTTMTPIYYPVDGNNKVDFIAYYPHKEGQTLSASYPVNVATQTKLANIDLMYSNNATAKNKLSGDVEMVFYHKLSKVIINTTADAGLTTEDLNKMTVTLKGMNTTALFDLTSGVLRTPATPAVIAAYTAIAGSQYEAIVLPASFAEGALSMEFALNNTKNEVFKRVNTVAEGFEPGKVYTYNVIIKRTEVTLTCNITNWVDGPTRTGDAE